MGSIINGYRQARGIGIVIFLGVIVLQFIVPLFSDGPYLESLDPLGILISTGVGLICLVAIWFSFRPPAHERREFQDAPLGVGMLVSARATGTSFNDQPEIELVLDVDTPDGRSIRGTAHTIVNQGELAQLTPGSTFPVRYREDGRFAVAPDAETADLQNSLYASQIARGMLTEQQVDVATRGTDATAVIMAMQPTGEIAHGQAVLHLDLRVNRPDGSSFDAKRDMPAAPAALEDLQPGRIVQVRYLPSDETYVAISTRVG
ncbi:hypothetical protein ACSS7Z_13000 [Microbacterium sp. A82]|uniref:hypothetical protein n=1 Tax=Microbacterium sp. A82 TaxID=3450452 RepID=UPI003F3EB612